MNDFPVTMISFSNDDELFADDSLNDMEKNGFNKSWDWPRFCSKQVCLQSKQQN